MEETVYADIVGNITLNNGMVRIDLYREAQPGEHGRADAIQAQEDSPVYVFNRRIVMPVVGFVQSYPMFRDLIGQMEAQGAIKLTPVHNGP